MKTNAPIPTPLRLRRLSAGFRLYDLERATGMASTRISQIERGEGTPPTKDELSEIDRALQNVDASFAQRPPVSRSEPVPTINRVRVKQLSACANGARKEESDD